MAWNKQLDTEALLPYVQFQTSRSGGSGGQHVNKVETKVTLLFDIDAAPFFSADEKEHIRKHLSRRLQSNGLLQVTSQETRSQLQNKEIALQKLVELLASATRVRQPRKATKPSKAALEKRLDAKRRQALRKINRKKDWL
ncbi:aminoacyl-tRNA hydrolase [Parapedobacter sp. ISTM3]|nr:aminoacyl-tRNA hydrolase [Parapedobacter sp. ISTM3]